MSHHRQYFGDIKDIFLVRNNESGRPLFASYLNKRNPEIHNGWISTAFLIINSVVKQHWMREKVAAMEFSRCTEIKVKQYLCAEADECGWIHVESR